MLFFHILPVTLQHHPVISLSLPDLLILLANVGAIGKFLFESEE